MVKGYLTTTKESVFPVEFNLGDRTFRMNADGSYDGHPSDLRNYMESVEKVSGSVIDQSGYMLVWLAYRMTKDD